MLAKESECMNVTVTRQKLICADKTSWYVTVAVILLYD